MWGAVRKLASAIALLVACCAFPLAAQTPAQPQYYIPVWRIGTSSYLCHRPAGGLLRFPARRADCHSDGYLGARRGRAGDQLYCSAFTGPARPVAAIYHDSHGYGPIGM